MLEEKESLWFRVLSARFGVDGGVEMEVVTVGGGVGGGTHFTVAMDIGNFLKSFLFVVSTIF
jgi:hypothetical protein